MRRIYIAQELAGDGRFYDNMVVEDENRYEATRIESKEIWWAGSIHINDSLFEGNAYFSQADVDAVGP